MFLGHLGAQPRLPFYPWHRIRRFQNARLRRTVRLAYDSVPFYREEMHRLGIRPHDIRAVEDLAALPLLNGRAMLELGDALLAGGRPEKGWLQLSSGGSMSRPKTVYLDPASYVRSVTALARQRVILMRTLGRRNIRREAFFAPPEGMFRKNEQVLRELLWAPKWERVERRHYSLFDDPEKLLREVAAFGADHFAGYGSHLGRLFQVILETDGLCPLPRAATYSSDEMPEAIRRAVEDRGTRVFSAYTAAEAIYLGFSCGEGEGMHLNVDLYPLRLIDDDGRSLGPGESGSVVISNLASRATVLLNYRLGDRARLVEGPCPCGRTLPRIADLEGRDDEWVARTGGRQLHSQAVRSLFTFEAPRVWTYRVVQEEVDRFVVTVVPAPGVDRATLAADIVRMFRDRLGAETRVEITFAEQIEQTAGGKLRTFFSRVRA